MKVYLGIFIQGFYQHLTGLGQLNWLEKKILFFAAYLPNLIWRHVDEIKTSKNLKNTYRIKCLFVFVRDVS